MFGVDLRISTRGEDPPASSPPTQTLPGQQQVQGTGLASLKALCLLARLHQVSAEPETLMHALGLGATSADIGANDLLLAAQHLGLRAKLSRSTVARLHHIALPALALLHDGRIVLLARCDADRVLYFDAAGAPPPANATGSAAPAGDTAPVAPTIAPLAGFAELWTGQLILVTSRASLLGQLARFDFSWFIPSLVKYRKLLGEVLVVSFFLQLAALVSPLFFQAVMDKVLVHNALTTLDVLMIGLGVVIVFESVLTLLRSYVFSHTTSRIDVELGARLFRHLLQLPLAYFQARRVGDSVARVRELENIRSFLTGNAVTLLLDLLFSGVFIA
ncbi:MAG: peptidase, partial [Pseudomonadota bacterium]